MSAMWETRRAQAAAPEGQRYCGHCRQYKATEEFGRKNRCRQCWADIQRAHRHKKAGAPDGTKWCQHCRQYLPFNQFEAGALHCHGCADLAQLSYAERKRQAMSEWRQENKECTRLYNQRYNESGHRKAQRQDLKKRRQLAEPPRPRGRPRKGADAPSAQQRPVAPITPPTPRSAARSGLSAKDQKIVAGWLRTRAQVKHSICARVVECLVGAIAPGVALADITPDHIRALATFAGGHGFPLLTDQQRKDSVVFARDLFAYMMAHGHRTDNPVIDAGFHAQQPQRAKGKYRQCLIVRDSYHSGDPRAWMTAAWSAGERTEEEIEADIVQLESAVPKTVRRREVTLINL